MSPARRLLLVHAHPDDETLTTGGTIARYAAEPDTGVTVVTCTLGEEGEVIGPELAELAPDRGDQLGGYRIRELEGALAALGGPDHRFLGGPGRWRDTGMVLAGHGTRAALPADLHPRAFAADDPFGAQLAQLLEIVDEVRPQVLVSYAADGTYGHPDHVRAHELTVAAAAARPDVVAKLYFAVRSGALLEDGLARLLSACGDPGGTGLRWPEPDEHPGFDETAVTTRVDVAGYDAERIAAMRAHATQIDVRTGPGWTAFAMSNGIVQPLLGVEEFVLAGAPAGCAESDLFEGVDP
ncbi:MULTISPECIES: N-acetyl-1-D-myo-inositol-2-amino-2-deoxy-alpha-D-glucopyranoside deacetylase [Pseudonocardia]|uniref:1D-myo-inositol 2-acetamido-2-deoxy-alpha-D-glucopyranoside deacetylase n=2 Tax=Pseudonocardia TaxID=1847 RepID=A0A1Y2N4L7_PSEAH|nr:MULTISPECIES: N-acetyl-1-D-myo-inositol-2-amino-2-deoxy-alpha-D-glucopyranoside deacetylase [Pseudonocardia]OSY42420.1 1D-myo-inositol 2-acetamido-2-deoxy-alpha-D-glucopyranoside deacetylase [Pseudonocardia autotrophica]TDN75940.1 N-acetyl-1-D-myo-inositol-2-amino-2-deoxy-alpha-D-glucopyranoside deacetylase [Pseudonocardia autotrophica]BBF99912.1 1D-myo-inositol 2-acetamido-2-deoxy-alpha-D-glucopyranoside deacetylase [Pseudonocardia autotrophica]GEC24971.1 1D-myo-inositol 2-acetamido-2-deoxy